MKVFLGLLQIAFLGVAVCFAASSARSVNNNSFINRIDGTVWDPYHRPVSNVYVELQNELNYSISRIRTTTSGRFSFSVNKQGNYFVKVFATGTNYLDAIEPVEIVNVTQFSSDNAYVDVYLKFDKRKINTGIAGVTDAVFVQEIPDEARRLYKSGVKDLENNNDKGFDEIEAALKIFPTYFDALNKLGCTYVQRQQYPKSVPYLVRSIDINQKSFSSYYALAYAAYKLNQFEEGITAAMAATTLRPNSVNAQLLHGTLLRLEGQYEKAEKTLLAAKSLSKETPMAEIHWQLALLYNKLGRDKEAADELETYLKIQPDADNKKEIKDLISKLRKKTS